MIYGIGTDLIDFNRINKTINTFGSKFLYRIYSKEEIKLSYEQLNKNLFFAERFSIKEAIWKALSPKQNEIINFNEIQLIEYSKGYYVIDFLGKTKLTITLIEKKLKKKFNFQITVTYEKVNVLSFVTIYLIN